MKKLTGKYLKLQKIVEKELSCSAHNMEHTMRVYNMALNIAKHEKNVNSDILKSATLLHDIARVKEDGDKTGNTCHAKESAKMCQPILQKFGYSKEEIEKIQHCILAHRFKTHRKPESIEAKILFDADKLDSLGAIVIIRAGMWMGKNGCSMTIPKISLKKYAKMNLVGGKLNGRIKNPSLHNLFYEHEIKDRKLSGLMYTQTAKKIAKQRLKFTDIFIERLKNEYEGVL